MKKLFTFLLIAISIIAFSQENALKCFSTIIPAYKNPQIQREYKNESVVYEYKNATIYKSNFPICISRMIFKNNGELSAYQISFNNDQYFASPKSFKINDSLQQINRYKNLSLDSLAYFKNSGEEIQKINYPKYLQNIRSKLIKKYGAKNAKQIINGEIWIGMTTNMLIESMGEPNHINSTETQYSYTSQYIYETMFSGTQYIYIENDKVTAIQSY